MLIYISAHLPSKDVPEAGQKISYNNLEVLLENEKNVCSIVFINQVEREYTLSSNFFKASAYRSFFVTNSDRVKNCIRKFFFPVLYSSRFNSEALMYLNSVISENPHFSLFLDYEQAAIYLWFVDKSPQSTVIFFHDVNSQLYYRRYIGTSILNIFKKIFYFFEFKKLVYCEKYLAKKGVSAVVISEKDKDILISLGFEKSKVSVKEPVVSDFFYSLKRNQHPERSIFFWGAMNRKENQEAVCWFLTYIYPYLNSIQFYVVGANPPDFLSKRYSSLINVKFVGFVENPSLYFENCSLMVAPLLNGAGVKIKVLEALAANVPVVSTSVGAEGVLANSLLKVSDDVGGFAKAILEILELNERKYFS